MIRTASPAPPSPGAVPASHAPRAPLALLVLLLAACTEDDGVAVPGAGQRSASGDFLLGDAAVDGLSAFEVDVQSLRLERDDGTLTDELFTGTLRVELTGLEARSRLIAHADFPSGTYRGVVLGLGPEAFPRGLDGGAVEVDELSSELAALFPAPEEIEPSTSVTVALDLDLARSLTGDPATGPIRFAPRGSAALVPAALPVALEEFDALVVDRDVGTLGLILVPFADGDRRVPLEQRAATLEPGALLVDRLGFLFDQAPFFYTLLVPGLSVIRVEASTNGEGTLSLRRIELEDQDGGASPISALFPVGLEGRIVGGIPGVSFQLAVREIERGATIAAPVLAGLADPTTVQVAVDLNTRVFAAGVLVPAGALFVGQDVKVRFASFSAEPFFATRVSILDLLPTSSGQIVATDELPEGFDLALAEGDPLLRAGLVESRSTAVEVALDDARIVLETAGEPALVADELTDGLDVRVRGLVSGPPEGPRIAAREVRVRPIRVVGATVTKATEIQGFFTMTGGTNPDGPDGSSDAGGRDVLLDPDAIFRGAATTSTEFFDLFDTLDVDEELEVDVEALLDEMPGALRGFTVESRVR